MLGTINCMLKEKLAQTSLSTEILLELMLRMFGVMPPSLQIHLHGMMLKQGEGKLYILQNRHIPIIIEL
jgi:hypothetical protein